MMQFLIQRAQRDGLGVLNARIGDLTVPQHVIKDYQPADADQLKRAFVIFVVVIFIRINEGEVESPRLPVKQQIVESLDGWRQTQRELVGYPRSSPLTTSSR